MRENKITITVLSKSEAPPRSEEKRPSLQEKVDEYIEAVEANGPDSTAEYNYLKLLYKKLNLIKKLNPKYRELRVKLKDVILKHGKYDNDSELLRAEDIFRDQIGNGYCLDDYK